MKEQQFMPQIRATVGVALILTAMLSPGRVHASSRNDAAPGRSMTVNILPSSGPKSVGRKGLLTLRLAVRGLTLDARHIGKRPAAGHGHIQVYLDRVPSDAFKSADLRGMVAISAGTLFTVDLKKSLTGGHSGKHRLIVTLARNNYVLYRTRTPAFSFIVH